MAKKWTGEVREDINGGVEFSEGDIIGKADFNKIVNNSIAIANNKIYRHIITIEGGSSMKKYCFECYSSKNTPINFSGKEVFSITRMTSPTYYYNLEERLYVSHYNVVAQYDEDTSSFRIFADFIHYRVEGEEVREEDSGEEVELEGYSSYDEVIEVLE